LNIVHTYFPRPGGRLTKEILYQMSLSCLLARRNYIHVYLYTDEKSAAIIEKIGLPYKDIFTIFNSSDEFGTFSIPKIITYSLQKDPFIHIDLDSFFFKNYNFEIRDALYFCFPETKDLLNFGLTDRGIYKTYMKNSFEAIEKLPEELVSHVKFSDIPNMSIFGGHRTDLIKEISEYCLNLYYDNREFFDSDYYNACIIEQLFFPAVFRMIISRDSEEWKSKNPGMTPMEEPRRIKFFFDDNPSRYDKTPEGLIINSQYNSTRLESMDDIRKNVFNDFDGFLHLNGMKTLKEIMFIVRQRIISDFGIEYVERINKEFPDLLEFENDAHLFYSILNKESSDYWRIFPKKIL